MATGRTDMRFQDPILTYLNFIMNKDFQGGFDGTIDLKISMHIQRQENNESLDENSYISSLKIDIGAESEFYPFYCEIEMTGVFFLNIETDISEDDFTRYNTAAILYSYARPIISDIVAKSGYPPYNLPFMNFAEEDIEFIDD